jgi:hypothetical protein
MVHSLPYAAASSARPLDIGVVVDVGWDLLDFAVPHLRQYWRDHAGPLNRLKRP